MRKITELEKNWIFIESAENVSEAVAAEGVLVSLPHTWNAEDGQDGGNDYHRGTCWYRRLLKKPEMEEGERAYLEFDGAAMTADVYLNGEKLAHHEGGFSRFRVDITEKLTEGENKLAVARLWNVRRHLGAVDHMDVSVVRIKCQIFKSCRAGIVCQCYLHGPFTGRTSRRYGIDKGFHLRQAKFNGCGKMRRHLLADS